MMKVLLFVLLVGLATAAAKKTSKVGFKRAVAGCADNEFQCKNGLCIQEEWTCDTDNDCWDGSDENLPECPPRGQCTGNHEFKCTNNRCIPIEFRCDGDNDCLDRSDETGCTEFKCTAGEVQCDNGVCIEREYLCDEEDDCGNKWDENVANCPTKSSA